MEDKLEKLAQGAYRHWKAGGQGKGGAHPDEEDLVGLSEGKLPPEEQKAVKEHLVSCDSCAEAFAMQVKLKKAKEVKVPDELLLGVKNLVSQEEKTPLLEIMLKVRETILEIVSTTGDVLMGQELVPAPVLRSRQIKDFKDEVVVLKDFADIRVEIKIENKGAGFFNLIILAKEKQTAKVIKDVRVSLMKDDVELESYIGDSGKVVFDHVLLGRYTVYIATAQSRLASILLDIRT